MDPLKYLFEKLILTSRISHWTLMVAEFNIKYITTKSVKGRAMADYLSDLAIEFGEERDFLFPDEGMMEIKKNIWKMYFNGVANQKGYEVGIILIAPGGAHTPLAIKLKYTSTNNTAEYEACIIGMEAALSLRVDKIDVFGDLKLIISQVRGEWWMKHERLMLCYKFLESLKA